jgi:penicillin-binding protein 1B
MEIIQISSRAESGPGARFSRWPRERILRALGVAGAVGLAAFLLVSILLYSSYQRYASLLDERIARGALEYPAGIYAAPRRITTGEAIDRDELLERLLRAGYQEGVEAGRFVAGSFTLDQSSVEIRTNEFARTEELPASVRVSFAEQKPGRKKVEKKEEKPGAKQTAAGVMGIVETDSGRRLDHIRLPAELITADINTKKQIRRAAGFDEIPSVLVNAITAIEDRRFFEHSGLDVRGLARALWKNLWQGSIKQGGSTITQQLVKTQFLTPDRTYQRKFAEAMMALALERRLTKEQIFALYCDRIYLGHSGINAIYGFKQAAEAYYGKKLSDLTVSEAAFLAGLIQAPNRYSPHTNLEAGLARRNLVLAAMVETGRLKAEEAELARAEQPALKAPQPLDTAAAPHFVDYLRRELIDFDEGDAPQLRIETTLDLDLQQAANHAVTEHLARLDRTLGRRDAQPEAALIAIDPRTGEILAMVGGRNYAESQLNRATDARRQPGSVFKPIVYAAALSRGFSPTTTFENAPRDFAFGHHAVYRPRNFGGSYSGRPVMLRESLVRSLNVVTVDAAMQVGLGNLADMAERIGLPRPDAYPSMALGAFEASPFDVARAYSTFAGQGMRVDPIAVREVMVSGESILKRAAVKSSALPASIAYLVTDALAEVVNRGTATRVRQLGYRGPAAGKTGTSRDAWFAGYTPNLLVVVWVGYDDHRDLRLTGGEAAVPIFASFIKRALALRPDLSADRFARPGGLEEIEIDAQTGLLANEYCPQRRKVLVTGFMIPPVCQQHHELVLDESVDLISPLDLTLPLPASFEPDFTPPEVLLEPPVPDEDQ